MIIRLAVNLALYWKEGWNEERRTEFIRHFEKLRRRCEEFGLTMGNWFKP